MKIVKSIATGVLLAGMVTGVSTASFAGGHGFKCKVSEESMAKPGGFPDRALTMIVPYGPGGGSGQVAAAMAKAVTDLTGVDINRDHKPGGSGSVGTTAYMAHQLMAIMFWNISMTHHQRMRLTRQKYIQVKTSSLWSSRR